MGPALGRGDRVVCTAWASSPVSVFCAHAAGGVRRWLCASTAPGHRKSRPCSLSRPTPGCGPGPSAPTPSSGLRAPHPGAQRAYKQPPPLWAQSLERGVTCFPRATLTDHCTWWLQTTEMSSRSSAGEKWRSRECPPGLCQHLCRRQLSPGLGSGLCSARTACGLTCPPLSVTASSVLRGELPLALWPLVDPGWSPLRPFTY